MSKPFLIGFGAMALVIAGLVWIGFVRTAGNHLAPAGSIGKVRAVKADEDLTFVVVDFNVTNDSDRDMIVRTIESSIETADGREVAGSLVADSDIQSAFKSYQFLGPQYNPVLKERDVIAAHHSVDRMVGLRFDAPESEVENRKKLTLRLWDVTGVAVELTSPK